MPPRKPFLLRIDPALWAELEAWAQDELRSVNGQIEYVLKQAVLCRKHAAAVDAPNTPESAPPSPGQTAHPNDPQNRGL
jgi:hypothetical protein